MNWPNYFNACHNLIRQDGRQHKGIWHLLYMEARTPAISGRVLRYARDAGVLPPPPPTRKLPDTPQISSPTTLILS